MLRVGLTGGIGAGKSAVAARLAERGAWVVDADLIARELVAGGTPGLAAVVAAFGPDVLDQQRRLDRPRLAEIVFADQEALARLNAIMHPLIAARSAELLAAAPPDAVVVYDMPLLVENDLAGGYDVVVVVQADLELRIERLIRDRGMTAEQVRQRLAAQASDAERQAVADVVIDNSGSPQDLESSVDALWRGHLATSARLAASDRTTTDGGETG